MDELYFSVNLEDGRTLCLAPLTDRRIALSGEEIADTSGYFLFENDGRQGSERVEVLAQVLSEEAALRLRDMLCMH